MPNTREKLIDLVTAALCNQSAEEVADHLIANGVTISNLETVNKEWIPVTERLPEGGKPVLVYNRDYSYEPVMEATLYEEGWLTKFDFDPWENDGISHWMPLPEPPKGE